MISWTAGLLVKLSTPIPGRRVSLNGAGESDLHDCNCSEIERPFHLAQDTPGPRDGFIVRATRNGGLEVVPSHGEFLDGYVQDEDPGRHLQVAFGVDLPAMMGLSEPAATPEAAEEPKQPFVLLVPGQSVAGVFGNYPIEQVGEYQQITLRMGPMLATQCGGYIALSPRADALKALSESSKKVP